MKIRAFLVALVVVALSSTPVMALTTPYPPANEGYNYQGDVTGMMYHHGDCYDGVGDRIMLTLYRDRVSNGDGTYSGGGQSRRICLNTVQDGHIEYEWYLDDFCYDVPGERATVIGAAFCGGDFDDSFNDRTSFMRVHIANGDSMVRICSDRNISGWCKNVYSGGTNVDFVALGHNDQMSSLYLYYHQP